MRLLHPTLLIATTLTLSCSAFAGNEPELDLIALFGSTCPSQNTWTQSALKKAQAIQIALTDIQNDPDCQGLSAEGGTAGAVATALGNLNKLSANNSNQISLLSSEQAIMSSISYATNEADKKSLQDLLSKVDAKITTSSALAVVTTQASAANDLLVSANQLVKQAVNNKKCFMKRKAFFSDLGYLVANVGAAVTAVNPVLGLGMATGGTMISSLVKMGSDAKVTRAMKRVDDGTSRPVAFSCVLESLTDDYCRGHDAITAIDWNDTHQNQSNYPISSPLYGMNLIKTDVPILIDWLASLRTAGEPQNKYDAARISDFKNKLAQYQSSQAIASGMFNESNASISDASNNPSSQWPLIRKMVSALVTQLYGPDNYGQSQSNNPLFGQFNKNEAKFFLIGLDAPKHPDGKVFDFDTEYSPLTSGGAYQDAIITTKEKFDLRFKEWVKRVDPSVNTEFSNTIQPSVQKALESAFDNTQTVISPYDALSNTIKYLQFISAVPMLKAVLSNPSSQATVGTDEKLSTDLIHYLPDTLEILVKIKASLDAVHAPGTLDDIFYQAKLDDITSIAKLEYGGIFIQNRLTDHVNAALMRYITDPAQSSETAPILAQTLASSRMTELLTASNPQGGTGPVKADINTANVEVLSVLRVFVDTFQKEIGGTLEYLKEQESIYTDPDQIATFKEKRSRICLLLTEMPYWPNKISFSYYCEGTSVSNTKNGPVSPALTKDYSQGKHTCTYYKLKRDTLIYETRKKMGLLK